MYDFCAIGDALIDFIPGCGYTPENPIYQCEAGGTVANVLAAAGKLGMRVMFVGKIGDDCLGQILKDKMAGCGVALDGCVLDSDHFTTQSFVSLGENGERSFSFSRKYGADIWLQEEDLPMEKILKSSMIGFSGMCMTDEPVRTATWKAIKEAYRNQIPIVLDVNYRDRLWKSEDEMIQEMRKTLPFVTLYKSSEEEALLLTGKEKLREAAEAVTKFGCKAVFITLGEKGSYYYMDGKDGIVKSFPVRAVDTTGAGDSFFAGLLYQIRKRNGIEHILVEDLPEMMKFANAAGALATTKKGGVTGTPLLQEVEEFLEKHK